MLKLKQIISVLVISIFSLHACLYHLAYAYFLTEKWVLKNEIDVYAFKVRQHSLSNAKIAIHELYEKHFHFKKETVLNLSAEQTQKYRVYALKLSQDPEWQKVVEAYLVFRKLSKNCDRSEFGGSLFNFLFIYDDFCQTKTQFGTITSANEKPAKLSLSERGFHRRVMPIALIEHAQLRLLEWAEDGSAISLTFSEQMQRLEIENGERGHTSLGDKRSTHKIPYILHILTRNVAGIKISLRDSNVLSKNDDTEKWLRGISHIDDIYYTSLIYSEAVDTKPYQQIYIHDTSKLGKHNLQEYDDMKTIQQFKYREPNTNDVSFIDIGLIKHGFHSQFIRKKAYNVDELLPTVKDGDPVPKVYHDYQDQYFAKYAARELGVGDLKREGIASNFVYLMGIPSPEIYFYSTSTIYMESIRSGKTKGRVGVIAPCIQYEIYNRTNKLREVYEIQSSYRTKSEVYKKMHYSNWTENAHVTDIKMEYAKFVEMGSMLMIDICLGNYDRFYGRLNATNILLDNQGTLNFIDTTFSAVSIFEVIIYDFLNEISYVVMDQEVERTGVYIESRVDIHEDLYAQYYKFLYRMVFEYATSGEISFVRRLLSKEERYNRYNQNEVTTQIKLDLVSAHIPGKQFLTDKDNEDYIARAISEGMIEGLLMIGRKFDPFYFTDLDQKLQQEELYVIRKIFSQTREFVRTYIPNTETAYEIWTGEVPSTFTGIPYANVFDDTVFRSDPMEYKYLYIPPERDLVEEPRVLIFKVEETKWIFMIEDKKLNTDKRYDVYLGFVVFKSNGDIVLKFSNENRHVDHNEEILITHTTGKEGQYLGKYPYYPGHEEFDVKISQRIGDFVKDLKNIITTVLYSEDEVDIPFVKIENRFKGNTLSVNNADLMLGMDQLAVSDGEVANFRSMLKVDGETYPSLDELTKGGTLETYHSDFYKVISRAERFIAKTDQVEATMFLSYKMDMRGLYDSISTAFDTVFENLRLSTTPHNIEDKDWKDRKIILDQYLMLLEKIEKNIKLGHILSKVKVRLDNSGETEFPEDQKFLEKYRRAIKIGFYVPNKDIAHTDVLTVLSAIVDNRLDKVIWVPSTLQEEEILKNSLSMYGELFEVATVPSHKGNKSKKISKDGLFHHMLELNVDRRMDAYYIQPDMMMAEEYFKNNVENPKFSSHYLKKNDKHRIHVLLCDLDNFNRTGEESRAAHIMDVVGPSLMTDVALKLYVKYFSTMDVQTGKGRHKQGLHIRWDNKKATIDYFFKHTELYYELSKLETLQGDLRTSLTVRKDNFHLFLYDYSKKFIHSDASLNWVDERIENTQDEEPHKDTFLGYPIERKKKRDKDPSKVISTNKLIDEKPRQVKLRDNIEHLAKNELHVTEKFVLYLYTDASGKKYLYFLLDMSLPEGLPNAIYSGCFSFLDNIEFVILGSTIVLEDTSVSDILNGNIQYSKKFKKPSEGIINYKEYQDFIDDFFTYVLKRSYEFFGQADVSTMEEQEKFFHQKIINEMVSQIVSPGFYDGWKSEGDLNHSIAFDMMKRAIKNLNLESVKASVDGEQLSLGTEINQIIQKKKQLYDNARLNTDSGTIPLYVFKWQSLVNKAVYLQLLITLMPNTMKEYDQVFFSLLGPAETAFQGGVYQGLIEIVEPGHAVVFIFTKNKGMKSNEYIHVYHSDYQTGTWDPSTTFQKTIVNLVGQIADAIFYGRQITYDIPWLYNTEQVLSHFIEDDEYLLKRKNLWQMGIERLITIEDPASFTYDKILSDFSDELNRMIHFGIGTALQHIQNRSQLPFDTLIKNEDIEIKQEHSGSQDPHYLFFVKGETDKMYFVFQGPESTAYDPFHQGIYFGYAVQAKNNRIHVTLVTKNPRFPHNTVYILPENITKKEDGISVFISLFSSSHNYDLSGIELYTLPLDAPQYFQDMKDKNKLKIGYPTTFSMENLNNESSVRTFLARIANVIQNVDKMLQQQ